MLKIIFLIFINFSILNSSNDKFTYLESVTHFSKKDPGPNKYTPQEDFTKNKSITRPRTAFYANMSTSTGRGDKKIKKDKAPGPTTYRWEEAQKASSTSIRGPVNVLISGMGREAGAKVTLKHADKLKVKTNRFFD